MAFWQKQSGSDGWTAVEFGVNRIAIADVTKRCDARPRVHACESFARDGGDLDALKRLKGAKRLNGKRCTTLLWHGQYQLLQIDAPENSTSLPADELRDALRWRIKEMVDFPVDQAGIDILQIPAQGGRSPHMWVVASNHTVLQPRILLFQDAKVNLEAIDIPELAQRNLSALLEDSGRGLALVAFDTHENGGGRLTISYQGELYMTRHLDVSGPNLAGPNAESLQERVLLDIQRSLDNFDRSYSSIPLTRLLIGPLPGGEAFVAYLGQNLSLPVSSVNLADVMDFEATPRLDDMAAQADAWLVLGAALRD